MHDKTCIADQMSIYSYMYSAFFWFRDGCQNFFNKLHDKEVPLLIFSAGVGDVIREIIKQNSTTLYSNMHVVSNDIDFNSEVRTFHIYH